MDYLSKPLLESFYTLNLITSPTSEIIDLDNDEDSRNFLKIKTTDTDYDLIKDILLPSARLLAEKYTNRAFFTQTWEMVFDDQPTLIDVPKGNLQSVTSIKTYALDGTSTTETAGNYTVITGDYGRVFLETGNTWTSTTRPYARMYVRFVAGWTAVASIPEPIKNAVLGITAHLYENRESLPTIGDAEEGAQLIPSFSKLLLDSYKLYRI